MNKSRPLIVLSWLLAGLALVATVTGLFWQVEGSAYAFTTLGGETVQIYGQGIYRHDSLLIGAGFRGTDLVTLVVALPLLVVALFLYQRGSLRGGLLLLGALGYFLYNTTSLAFGAYYNPLILVYIAQFSISLWAFALALVSVDAQALAASITKPLPHRVIGIFLIVAGTLTALVWLGDIIPALLENRIVPNLEHYTTVITYVIDIGIVLPATALAGVLLLRRAPFGYVAAVPTLMLAALIGLVVIGQTIVQAASGVPLTPAILIGKVGSFVIMSSIALWCTLRLFRSIETERTERA